MTNKKPKYLIILALLLLIIIGALVAFSERQNISDWLALRNYTPPTAIAELASQDGMTAYTRHVFYVNHPKLEPKTTFASECPNDSEQMVVLGCYHVNQHGIFVLAVNNADLYGIEQVTAAYETLHAIYQRLSASEQATLNSELISFENNGLSNPTVEAQIAGFRKTEPGAVLNEMTSLFGTEVSNLPQGLTNFYAQYFSSRQTLLNYYNDYQSAFSSREQQITTYDTQLTNLNSQITSDENTLKTELTNLANEQSTLNNERNSGQISEYNSQVDGYNEQVDSYNSLAENVKSLVSQYNQIVASRNSLALEEQQLTQAITSTPESISN